ncbi:Beta-hexosaminidase [termite gut metagenome]|uniref:beta-N-acetylhexosaminidase n=1 Tax=termite gut metagenome TaxID=433724 RepID=A0A5J4SAL4_9ZZZZ
MRRRIFVFFTLICCLSLKAQIEPLVLYKTSYNENCRQWVDSVLNRMSLREKIGQLFIYTIAPVQTQSNVALLYKAIQTHQVGGLLFSGGELENQVQLTNQAQKISKVPLMITFDGEWGLSMRLQRTPEFPKNMVLGCIQDDHLIYEYGKEVARQCREIGVHVNFAPVADVNINLKNPVINVRSFGELPNMTADKVVIYASGLESGGVLSVSKHFPGHGDTEVDSHKALPVLPFTRERLDSVELYPFRKVISAGLGAIMVGHLHVTAFDGDNNLPSSLSYNVVQKLLKDELAFKGLVFTDALVMKGVSSNPHVCLQALKAGNDVVLSPPDLEKEINGVLQGVDKGEISEEEITLKCRKVLTYKYALGIHNVSPVNIAGLRERIDTPKTHRLIKQLNEAAVTVLCNKERTLPFDTSAGGNIAILNVGKENKAMAFSDVVGKFVHSKFFQLPQELTEAEGRRLCDSLASYKHTIVCISENDLTLYRNFFKLLTPGLSVVYVFFTSKETILQVEQSVALASSVVLGHSVDKSVQVHVANILFGKASANGRLSASIGKSFKAGDGITISPRGNIHSVSSKSIIRKDYLARIDTIAREGILEEAYPGCQIVILKDGETVYDKCFGTFTGRGKKVSPTDIYDVASLSKTSATLLAVMKLYDKRLFKLSDKLSDYVPFLKGTDKENMIIRDALFHQTGLPATIPYYRKAIDESSYTEPMFQKRYSAKYPVRVTPTIYAQKGLRLKNEHVSHTPDDNYSMPIADNLWLNKSFKEVVIQEIINTPLESRKYRYSCINFILLQQMVEQLSGMSLDKFLMQEFYEPMGLKHTSFLPTCYFAKKNIVPSTKDLFLRKTTLQGYVHDELAAFLGGVSGNAGLFSTARDIAQIHQMILDNGIFDGHRYLSEDTCRLFTTETSNMSHRGLGFNKPVVGDPQRNSCSELTPASVYGHTGFTGTCAWVDPENNLVYVFLSNRLYPNSWVNKLSALTIRERIQDVIYQSLQSF